MGRGSRASTKLNSKEILFKSKISESLAELKHQQYKKKLFDNPSLVEPGGFHYWENKEGQLHREGDLPARVSADGKELEWWVEGVRHRDNGPAIIRPDGTEEWYQNDLLHRDDGPALINNVGDSLWYQHGELHRDNGPAVESADGTKEWIQKGELHREDGPAIMYGRDDDDDSYFLMGISFHQNERKFKKALKILDKLKKEIAYDSTSITAEEWQAINKSFREKYAYNQ